MGLKLGIEDPEQWLEDCPERVTDLWDAYYQLEPWGGERELLARILATLRCLLAGKYDEDKVAKVMQNVDDMAGNWMPGDWIGQPEPKPEQSIQEVEAALAARFG